MNKQEQPSAEAEMLTVSDAARFLGVSASTLRNWDRAGKLTPHRHPMNRYRLYLRRDLERLRREILAPGLVEEKEAE